MAGETKVNKVTLYRGTAPILRYTISDTVVSDPASGWTTKWTLRTDDEAASYVVQVSGSWNSTTSTIDVSLTRAQTLLISAGDYVASLFRTSSGSEDILAKDSVSVAESVYDPQ